MTSATSSPASLGHPSVFQENRQATQRLMDLVDGLSEEDWNVRLPNDWPVHVVFGHLAFWDQRVLQVVAETRIDGVYSAAYLNAQVNDILTPILAAIAPHEAGRLAIRTATELDEVLEGCSEDLLAQVEGFNPRFVQRHLHRNHHLDAVVRALQPMS